MDFASHERTPLTGHLRPDLETFYDYIARTTCCERMGHSIVDDLDCCYIRENGCCCHKLWGKRGETEHVVYLGRDTLHPSQTNEWLTTQRSYDCTGECWKKKGLKIYGLSGVAAISSLFAVILSFSYKSNSAEAIPYISIALSIISLVAGIFLLVSTISCSDENTSYGTATKWVNSEKVTSGVAGFFGFLGGVLSLGIMINKLVNRV